MILTRAAGFASTVFVIAAATLTTALLGLATTALALVLLPNSEKSEAIPDVYRHCEPTSEVPRCPAVTLRKEERADRCRNVSNVAGSGNMMVWIG